MKRNKSNYLLYVFSTHKNQEKFVKMLAEEVVIISNSEDVKYYFGPESVVLKFSSNESFNDIGEYLKSILGSSGIVFFIHQYTEKNLSYWLDSEINEYLFGKENDLSPTEEQKVEFQKVFFKDLNDENFETISENEELFCEDNDIVKLSKKKKIPTLNELLDKISEKGLSSLNKTELELLNNYSK